MWKKKNLLLESRPVKDIPRAVEIMWHVCQFISPEIVHEA